MQSDNFAESQQNQILKMIFSSLDKSDVKIDFKNKNLETLKLLSETSPHFAEMLAANPKLIIDLPTANEEFTEENYLQTFLAAVEKEKDFRRELAILRKSQGSSDRSERS